KGGFKQVSEAALGNFEELRLEYVPEEEGTLMIYTANQTNENLDVYMDDMMVMHTEGPIVRADDYYPFGLTFNSSERSGYTSNNFLYNGFELQTDLDLGLYDYQARYYDPALGRFLNIDPAADLMRRYSPYNYAFDNPIRFIDPDGMFPDGINSGIFMRAALDPDVQKYSTQASNSASNILKGNVKIGKKVGTGLDVNTQLGPVKFKANVSAVSGSLETEVNNSGDVTYKGEVNVGDAEVELSVGDSKLTGEAKGVQLTAEYSSGEGIKSDVKAAKLEGKFSGGTTGFELKKDDAKIGGKVKVGKVVEVGGSIHLGELYDTVVNSFKAISAYGDALLNEVSRSTETQQEQQTENSFFNW
ncbi:MAG: RHS repeat-associated core domain-containing protein, partial [Cytophagales bacterium]|nr:RHS repeat-associated core domain-containing protein [Cytophagales bacterium]